MHILEFDFDLPSELIAQEPLTERDHSKMLIVDRKSKSWYDSSFAEFPSLVNQGDLIVINNTRVYPARLLGTRIVNGVRSAAVEVLLLKSTSPDSLEWEVLAKPGRALKIGAEIEFGQGRLLAVVTGIMEEGRRRVRFECEGDFNQVVDEIGNTPLPPYIKRGQNEARRLDEQRYQTIYASQRGAIAAPTAGLHFTPQIFGELKLRGIEIIEITHHVGYATFQPVRVEEIDEHRIAAEQFEISQQAAETINQARRSGGRIIAIGTTTTRAIESAAELDGKIRAERGSTELFIYPGYRFRAIDALLTNFHLPRSSLLMLVSAFAGNESEWKIILAAYRHAVKERYRFYSYGDCMFVI